MKLFKNIKSYFPKNSLETEKFTKQMSKNKGPCFMSLKTDKYLKNW